MTKNPIVNALLASAYILLVVTVMSFGEKYLRNTPDTFMAPVVFISMFTLSAAVMVFLFFYQPIQLYFDNKKKLAVNLFLQTLGVFGGITLLLVILLFSKII